MKMRRHHGKHNMNMGHDHMNMPSPGSIVDIPIPQGSLEPTPSMDAPPPPFGSLGSFAPLPNKPKKKAPPPKKKMHRPPFGSFGQP